MKVTDLESNFVEGNIEDFIELGNRLHPPFLPIVERRSELSFDSWDEYHNFLQLVKDIVNEQLTRMIELDKELGFLEQDVNGIPLSELDLSPVRFTEVFLPSFGMAIIKTPDNT